VADPPFGSFASIGEAKRSLRFVDICSLSFYFICGENNFEKIGLQKMSSKGILPGFAIQEDVVAELALRDICGNIM
jgi:hypothetical protein